MSCRQIAVAREECLVEITGRQTERPTADCIAHISLLEEDGAIVRPLVGDDGNWVTLSGQTDAAALDAALEYLENLFGAPTTVRGECLLGASAIGAPVSISAAAMAPPFYPDFAR